MVVHLLLIKGFMGNNILSVRRKHGHQLDDDRAMCRRPRGPRPSRDVRGRHALPPAKDQVSQYKALTVLLCRGPNFFKD